MKINSPIPEYREGKGILSAEVELDRPLPNYPDRLCFSVPEESGVSFSDRSDGFLVSLLTPVMFLGEDVRAEGVVSPRLLYLFMKIRRHKTCLFVALCGKTVACVP